MEPDVYNISFNGVPLVSVTEDLETLYYKYGQMKQDFLINLDKGKAKVSAFENRES